MSKRGLYGILGFFCLGGLLAVVADYLVSKGLRRITTSHIGAFNRAMEGRVNAQVVISGSSRAYRDYDPRVIQAATRKTCFNLARNGSHLDIQLAVLKAYLRHNAKPDLVVQNLDMHTFVLTPENEIFAPAEYVPYLNDPDLYHSLSRINGRVWKWKYIPLYGYVVEDIDLHWLMALKGLVSSGSREDHFDGYCPVDKVWNSDFERFRTKHPGGVQFAVQPEGVRILEDMIETCKSRGIKVVLIYSPQYYEMLSLVINRAQVFNKFREIAQHFDVPLWDYSGSTISERRDYFYNSQHLNREGASAFSHEIARRLTTVVDSAAKIGAESQISSMAHVGSR